MCGIAGLVKLDGSDSQIETSTLERLRDSLKHRGPDGDGIWTSPDRRVGLVHTRLSIIDLSPTGAQPMSTPDGNYTIVFNGEIYNYEEIRQRLAKQGVIFRGRSDTEVLLQLYVEMGSRCVDELYGMFAFAVWNARDGVLFCARDHLGEKPLYYVHTRDCFAFSSEVRALVRAGIVSGTPYDPGHRLPAEPGRHPADPSRTWKASASWVQDPGWNCAVDIPYLGKRRYWSIPFKSEADAVQDPGLATEMVHDALRTSVRRRLRADVPVGAFLSSGIDSSLLVALMKEQGSGDLRTFTVTLPGQRGDEADLARDTARRLGTNHHEIPLNLGSETKWLDEAIDDMDVPSVDGPNTWLVSRAVRATGAKVACSGLGGDELFYGYPTFTLIPRLARLHLDRILRFAPSPFKRSLRLGIPPWPRWSRIAEAILAGASVAALWYGKRSLMSDREVRELLIESANDAGSCRHLRRVESLGCPDDIAIQRQVSFFELSVYMHDQLLRDTDQMSMAHGLEVRVPLIGRQVVETVAGLGHGALSGNQPKALLRRILARYLPIEPFSKPKRGFTMNWEEILASKAGETISKRIMHCSARTASNRSGSNSMSARQGSGHPSQSWRAKPVPEYWLPDPPKEDPQCSHRLQSCTRPPRLRR